MFKEFKEFAMRGNVLDMAVGIIIGAAFGQIVTSLVADIIMPPIGLLLGKMDFANMFVVLSGQAAPSLAEAKKLGSVTLNYGQFINIMINFILVAFSVFLLVKSVNRMRRQPAEAPAPTTKDCPHCFSVIPLQATKCAHCTSELS